MDYNEKKEELEANLCDINYAIDRLEEARNCLRDITECEEVLGYIEDDIDSLKIIKEKIEEQIEDIEEQEEYGSDVEERRTEFERSAI